MMIWAAYFEQSIFSIHEDPGGFFADSSLPSWWKVSTQAFAACGVLLFTQRIGPSPRARYDVTFVGSLFAGVHDSRRHLLELLCDRFPTLRVFGPGVDSLPVGSSIRSHHAGPAWGREMYEVLRDSRVTVNEHGSIPDYANNCRLYEATGVGTLLVTDARANLAALFDPGREVAAYRSPEECAELVAYYLAHDEERAAIAAAGQARTLSEHTFRSRAEELVELVERYGRRP